MDTMIGHAKSGVNFFFVKYTSTKSGTLNKITLVSRFRRIVTKIKKSVSHMNRQKVPLIHRGEQRLKLRAICSHPINPGKLCAKMQRCQNRLLKRAFFWTWTAKIPSIHQRGLSLSGQKVNNQKEAGRTAWLSKESFQGREEREIGKVF